MTFRLINLAFTLLFGASAALQYNDSAGVIWAAIYLAGALIVLSPPLSTWSSVLQFAISIGVGEGHVERSFFVGYVVVK